MKKFLFIAIATTAAISPALAQKYLSKSAHVSFYSDTPMEKIEAHNRQGTTVVDFEKNEMVFTVLMKSFEFEKALMQEHFNEKYVESATYPKGTFKGKFTPKGEIALVKDGTYPVTVEGTMEIKGKTNAVTAEGVFTVKGGKVSGTSKFEIKLADYGIKIPGAVKDNIAETVQVNVDAQYDAYNK
ncbi:MAG: YceI family protein [Flavobacteriales bacterium]|nr:YceI family protein [Flavobacteriales bacterium]